jgi:hypothetical protein
MGGLRPSESNVLLAARSMIEHYGSGAAIEATRRADDELARGYRVSSATWSRIMVAIETLQIESREEVEKFQKCRDCRPGKV